MVKYTKLIVNIEFAYTTCACIFIRILACCATSCSADFDYLSACLCRLTSGAIMAGLAVEYNVPNKYDFGALCLNL